MSAPSKTNTPAPLTSKRDWAQATMDGLKSGLDDEPEVYDMKVGELKQRQQAKKEVKERRQGSTSRGRRQSTRQGKRQCASRGRQLPSGDRGRWIAGSRRSAG